jgi:hypothetical protein
LENNYGTVHSSLFIEGKLYVGKIEYDVMDITTGIIYPARIPPLSQIATGQDIINLINEDGADTNNSGLNADTVDGYQPSINDIPFTLVVRGGETDGENIVPNSSIINTSSIQLNTLEYSGPSVPGLISWNADESTINIVLNDKVTLHVGQEFLAFVYNASGIALSIGDVVYADSSFEGVTSVKLARANSVATSRTTLGVVTQPISSGGYGFVTTMGKMHNVDTSAYTIDTEVYLSPTEAGKLVTTKPSSPNYIVDVGWIAKVSETDGEIFVKVHVVPNADEINYNNQIIAEEDRLLATNVQSAIDELQLRKADVGLLSSNINLYPTTASSDIVGYNRMVSSLDDPDYNTIAVDVSTGTINTDDQLVGQLIADAGLFVGNPGIINITTIGNIKRTSGNNNQYAAFYFKVWQRNLAEEETLIATSSETPDVRPLTTDVYEQFSASALLNNGIFLSTDRIVIRYYANLTGNTGAVYAFQFGGLSPVRTLIPVPISVIPSADASGILVNTINFNTTTILQPADSNVQAALERLNTHNHDTRYYTETELNDGQLDTRYYTKLQLLPDPITDTGILDTRYAAISHTHTISDITDLSETDFGASVNIGTSAPLDPSDGDLWWNSTTGVLFIYYDDTTSAQWVQVSSPEIDSGALVHIGTTAPQNPKDGDLWWNNSLNEGNLYIYYKDGDTNQWVAASNLEAASVLTLGTTSSTAFRGDLGNIAYNHSQITNGTNPHGTTFANIVAKPTTISGYGITNAYTKTEVDNIVGDINTILDNINGEVI